MTLLSPKEAANDAERRQLMMGRYTYIYFIQVGDFIKIGQSLSWRRRANNLNCASPFECKVLHVEVQAPSYEKSLHRRFRQLRQKGEWFRAEKELLDFIAERLAEPNRSVVHRKGGW